MLLGAALPAHSENVLRIGLGADPDMLDPHLARTYYGRFVFASLCDRLVDVDEHLKVVPGLAKDWAWSEDGKTLTMNLREGVTFHDGEKFDAAAAKYNLDRALTLKGSLRKSEISSIESVEVKSPTQIAIHLKTPDAALLMQLTDRAGAMMAPEAAAKSDFAAHPVCSGPYKFESRVSQDRIVLSRFDNYWNKDAYHFDKIIYLPIPDASVRLANLRAGDLDLTEGVAASAEDMVTGLSTVAFINVMYWLEVVLSFLVPSSSGLAVLTMPIMAPLADFANVNRDLVVTAYQSASGIVNLVTPTSAVVMGGLAIARIPYVRYLKWVAPLLGILTVVIMVALSLGALM
jgi:peptide/nickel transport system substrate-binding protein